jgi:16S rRNA processing protein RimM
MVTVADVGEVAVAERGGTPDRPILRLKGVQGRDIRGRELLVSRRTLGELAEGEWLVDDLVGCQVRGLGEVTDVLLGPSVDVLQVRTGDGEVLVPLNRDAVRSVDLDTRTIEPDLEFLGIASTGG